MRDAMVLAAVLTAAPAAAEQPLTALEDMFRRPERMPFSRTLDDLEQMLDDNDGLFSRLAFTIVGQHATESLTGRDGLVNFTYDLDGAWRIYGDKDTDRGVLTWWITGGAPIGASSDADLSDDVGSGTGINDSLESAVAEVRELIYMHAFGDLRVAVGRTDATWRYDFNNIANDQREAFFAAPFDNQPAIPFPDPGLALSAVLDAGDALRFKFGVQQANATTSIDSMTNLRSDELFWVFETILQPEFDGLGAGTYRVTAWYNEQASQGLRGPGLALSLDQEIGGGLVPFFRFGLADSSASEFRLGIAGGLGFENSFGREGDLFGVGYGYTEPSDRTRNDEQVIEVFNRFEVNRFLAITPDIQVHLRPADNFVHDVVVVFGLRGQFNF